MTSTLVGAFPVDQANFGGNLPAADKLLELGAKFGDSALEKSLDYRTKEYLVKKLLDRGATRMRSMRAKATYFN